MLSKIKKIKFKSYFLLILILSVIYVGLLKTSFYQSSASITIKNLDESSPTTSLLGLVSGEANNNTQDAMTLQEYLKSYEMYDKINEKFNLKDYYNSFDLDILQRMYSFNDYEDYVQVYNKHLKIVYDPTSNITNISFLHVNSETAKQIVEFIINEAEEKLNEYNKKVAQKQLDFVQEETNKQKELLDMSIKKLESYQDIKKTIDPNTQVQTNESLLSTLKGKLVESQGKLEKISKYLTQNSFEVVDLKREIQEIRNSIKNLKKEQSGTNEKTLNKSIFEFQKLKTQVELDTELYKQALLQLQNSKLEVNKENKTLQVLVNANLAQSYSEPKRVRELVTVVLVLLLLYGIVFMLNAIIKDHRE